MSHRAGHRWQIVCKTHYGLNAAKAALRAAHKQYFDTHQLSQPVRVANPPRSLSGTKTEGKRLADYLPPVTSSSSFEQHLMHMDIY